MKLLSPRLKISTRWYIFDYRVLSKMIQSLIWLHLINSILRHNIKVFPSILLQIIHSLKILRKLSIKTHNPTPNSPKLYLSLTLFPRTSNPNSIWKSKISSLSVWKTSPTSMISNWRTSNSLITISSNSLMSLCKN